MTKNELIEAYKLCYNTRLNPDSEEAMRQADRLRDQMDFETIRDMIQWHIDVLMAMTVPGFSNEGAN